MDPFAALTVGVFFDKTSNARAMKVFHQTDVGKNMVMDAPTIAGSSSSEKRRQPLDVPAPVASLAIFGHKCSEPQGNE